MALDLAFAAAVVYGYIFGIPLALAAAYTVLYWLAYGLLVLLNRTRAALHRARRKFYRRLYHFSLRKISA